MPLWPYLPIEEEVMPRNRSLWALIVAVLVTLVLVETPDAWAQGNYKTLYRFKGGKDGAGPYASSVIFDAAGEPLRHDHGGRRK
jgi:hypothetical protein